MLRYTVLRLLIFFGFLVGIWLIPPMRDHPFVLVIIAGALSMVTSFYLLAPQRRELASRLAESVEARQTHRTEQERATTRTDEDEEDDEDYGGAGSPDAPAR